MYFFILYIFLPNICVDLSSVGMMPEASLGIIHQLCKCIQDLKMKNTKYNKQQWLKVE